MLFSLDIRRARKGDCLMLHYGSADDPGLALIDGGPAQVYRPYMKPRLSQIRKARDLDNEASLDVDLMMVSHIDDDHINGILELTKELADAKASQRPLPLKIRSVWHNAFDDIIGNNPEELLAAVTASFGAAALSGEPDTEGLDPDAAMVLASVGQGVRLRDDARMLGLRINPEVEGKLVMTQDDCKTIDMGKGLNLTIAGPMKKDLIALQKKYDAWLKKHEDKKKTKAALAAFTDTSVPNLSSIVVVAEAGGRRMLLTGDARGDKILKGLEQLGLLKKGDSLHMDILKLPHHGSDRNVAPAFFERITADHYVFSGNGEYGNPERETLQMLLDARGNGDFLMHFTYPIQDIDDEREKDWKKEQEKEKAKKKKVREDWSPLKHSLKAFFYEHNQLYNKVVIVEEGKPHIIDLLDKVDF